MDERKDCGHWHASSSSSRFTTRTISANVASARTGWRTVIGRAARRDCLPEGAGDASVFEPVLKSTRRMSYYQVTNSPIRNIVASVQTKVPTPDRILDASLKLFNEQGYHNVASLRIAMHLSISPSLLTYHFKSKEDIVQALFPRLESALKTVMELEVTHAAPEAIDRTRYVLKTLWDYRFFFIEILPMTPSDKRLLVPYTNLESRILKMMQHSFDVRISEGTMQAVPAPNSTEFLARTIWAVWLDWIWRERSYNPEQITPSNTSIYDVMLRSYSVVQPFFSHTFLDDIVVRLKARLELRKLKRRV
jgi:AcrR family transcriptional regulator